jgi:hypothetical protein
LAAQQARVSMGVESAARQEEIGGFRSSGQAKNVLAVKEFDIWREYKDYNRDLQQPRLCAVGVLVYALGEPGLR